MLALVIKRPENNIYSEGTVPYGFRRQAVEAYRARVRRFLSLVNDYGDSKGPEAVELAKKVREYNPGYGFFERLAKEAARNRNNTHGEKIANALKVHYELTKSNISLSSIGSLYV